MPLAFQVDWAFHGSRLQFQILKARRERVCARRIGNSSFPSLVISHLTKILFILPSSLFISVEMKHAEWRGRKVESRKP